MAGEDFPNKACTGTLPTVYTVPIDDEFDPSKNTDHDTVVVSGSQITDEGMSHLFLDHEFVDVLESAGYLLVLNHKHNIQYGTLPT
jgi:hypothetical protein